MSWENRNFKELGFIGRGKSRHRPRNDESLYGGDYPMIQTLVFQDLILVLVLSIILELMDW